MKDESCPSIGDMLTGYLVCKINTHFICLHTLLYPKYKLFLNGVLVYNPN